jgi:hypothetical protein
VTTKYLCGFCGEPWVDDDRFCPNCGSATRVLAPWVPPQLPGDIPSVATPDGEREIGLRAPGWLKVLFVLVLALSFYAGGAMAVILNGIILMVAWQVLKLAAWIVGKVRQ